MFDLGTFDCHFQLAKKSISSGADYPKKVKVSLSSLNFIIFLNFSQSYILPVTSQSIKNPRKNHKNLKKSRKITKMVKICSQQDINDLSCWVLSLGEIIRIG